MTKYVIMNGNKLYKNVKTMADFDPKLKSMNVTINGARRDKLFENPVTAIAYDLTYGRGSVREKGIEFDKKDIIKALDFWINDKVLENERLLKLNNKLEDFHETELKKLIETRETVLKLDNDTKFQRFIPDMGLGKYKALSTDTVEFYYIPKHSEKQQTSGFHYEGTVSGLMERLNEMANHTIDWGNIWRPMSGTDWTTDEISGHIHGASHTGDRNWTIRAPNNNPNTWSVNRYSHGARTEWRVIDNDWNLIANGFMSSESAQGYIEAAKERFLPSTLTVSDVSLGTEPEHPEDYTLQPFTFTARSITVQEEEEPEGYLLAQEGQRTEIIGRAGEDLRPGDLLVTDPNTGRFVKARSNQPRMNSSNAFWVNVRSVREGEGVEGIQEGLFIYPNGYTPTLRSGDSVERRGNNVFVHRVNRQLSPGGGGGPYPGMFPSIPGHRWVIDNQIAEGMIFIIDENGNNRNIGIDPGIPSNTQHVEFTNMYIQSVNTSVGSTVTLDLEFIGQNGARINCTFGGSNYPNWNINNNGPHTLNILGNNRVLLDGNEYVVLEPVTVTYDRILPPPTTTTGTPFSRTGDENMDDFIDYSDMSVMYSESLYPSENDYVTCIMSFRNSLVDIEVNIYMTGRQIPNSFEHHNVRIYRNRKDIIEIDGERIYVLEMEIRYK